MTSDDVIDGILQREGEGVPPYADPADAGGRTSWGISERSHPDAWKDGPPTRAEAKAIYEEMYVVPFDALKGVTSEALRAAVIDDGVLSGISTAIKRLQNVVRVTPDGVLGPQTLGVVRMLNSDDLLKAFVKERTVGLVRTALANQKNLKWLAGWVTRSLSFL